jgi:hypothetical protein
MEDVSYGLQMQVGRVLSKSTRDETAPGEMLAMLPRISRLEHRSFRSSPDLPGHGQDIGPTPLPRRGSRVSVKRKKAVMSCRCFLTLRSEVTFLIWVSATMRSLSRRGELPYSLDSLHFL